MALKFFNRKLNVIVGTRIFSLDNYKIQFNCPFSADSTPSVANVKIYNVSNGTIGTMTKGTQVSINAGYGAELGLIFKGEIVTATPKKVGVDSYVELKIQDTTDNYLKNNFTKTYGAGVHAITIVNDLINFSGLQKISATLGKDYIFTEEKAIDTTVISALKEIATLTESVIVTNNGTIKLRPANEVTGTAQLLSEKTGLIDSPQRVEQETTNADDVDVESGYKIKTLLNSKFGPDTLISVQSNELTGNFRITKGKHYGSNSSDYYSEFETEEL
jgi:hypothetical protein